MLGKVPVRGAALADMKLLVACVLVLLVLGGARAWDLVSTSPSLNATAATNGSVWIVLSPSCATRVLGRGCNPTYLTSTPCSMDQRWTYVHTAEPGNQNATQCTFTLSRPENATTCAVGLIATTRCE